MIAWQLLGVVLSHYPPTRGMWRCCLPARVYGLLPYNLFEDGAPEVSSWELCRSAICSNFNGHCCYPGCPLCGSAVTL